MKSQKSGKWQVASDKTGRFVPPVTRHLSPVTSSDFSRSAADAGFKSVDSENSNRLASGAAKGLLKRFYRLCSCDGLTPGSRFSYLTPDTPNLTPAKV